MNILKRYKKIIVSVFIVVIAFVTNKICIAGQYVGDIVVSYPWEEYTIWEKAAHKVMGLPKVETKQELYDKGIIKSTSGPFRKFNKSYYKKN